LSEGAHKEKKPQSCCTSRLLSVYGHFMFPSLDIFLKRVTKPPHPKP